VKEAIKTFVSDARFDGLGVGLQYFPLRKPVRRRVHRPQSRWTLCPEWARRYARSLGLPAHVRGTPMVPMLEGVLGLRQARARKKTDSKVVIV